jgi:hypothetical protein
MRHVQQYARSMDQMAAKARCAGREQKLSCRLLAHTVTVWANHVQTGVIGRFLAFASMAHQLQYVESQAATQASHVLFSATVIAASNSQRAALLRMGAYAIVTSLRARLQETVADSATRMEHMQTTSSAATLLSAAGKMIVKATRVTLLWLDAHARSREIRDDLETQVQEQMGKVSEQEDQMTMLRFAADEAKGKARSFASAKEVLLAEKAEREQKVAMREKELAAREKELADRERQMLKDAL